MSKGKYCHRKNVSHEVQLSKSLSWLLRHGCEQTGLRLAKGGFLYVDDILTLKNFSKYSQEDIFNVVQNNSKQRFTLEQEGEVWKIRANQGHSLPVEELDLSPVECEDDVPVVIHGTSLSAWDSIRSHGLKCMGRNHIHFAPGEPGQDHVISGMRQSCQVWIYIDISKAIEDGIRFYRSANNIILSPGDSSKKIDPFYFKSVVQTKPWRELSFDQIKVEGQIKGNNSSVYDDSKETIELEQRVQNLTI